MCGRNKREIRCFSSMIEGMSEQVRAFRQNVNQFLEKCLNATAIPAQDVDGRIRDSFLAPAAALAGGGKRTRALFLAAGWQMFSPTPDSLPVTAAAALELYQLSALIHDDIIDGASLRRGSETAHVYFQKEHGREHWAGSGEEYGRSGAILLGDFLLSLSALTFADAEAVNDTARAEAQKMFHRMTAEVAFGQYLDMRGEYLPLDSGHDAALRGAMSVLYHKSARYSVEVPLLLGAVLAGARRADLAAVSRIGRPLGEAFQMRDDVLGIFGDPRETGKPAGDDLREGKRTVLLSLTRKMLAGEAEDRRQADDFDALIGRELTDEELRRARGYIVGSGAFARHEKMISARETLAAQAARDLGRKSTILDLLMDLLRARRS